MTVSRKSLQVFEVDPFEPNFQQGIINNNGGSPRLAYPTNDSKTSGEIVAKIAYSDVVKLRNRFGKRKDGSGWIVKIRNY